MMKKFVALIAVLLSAGVSSAGSLAMSAYWQDHMVLQRDKPITVWGKDAAGRTVTVSFAGQTATAVTGSDGFWETTFAQTFAVSATPRALTITDNAGETLTLSDILVGDVFLAAGQSNMDRRLVHDHTYEEPQAVKDFCKDDDGIRFIRIARSSENTNGQENLFDLPPHKAVNDAIKYFGQGYDWAPAVDTNKNFVSSLALNFAHYIRQTNAAKGQDVPIGIIHASSGGTAIRSWLRPEVLTANGFTALSTDGGYWNNMMAPIKRAKFRAILWYQGCSDAGKTPDEYKQLMDVLVKDRRDRWGDNGDLPFYAVQIGTIGYDNGEVQTIGFDKYPAPSMSNNGQNYAFIREAQRLWDVSDTGTHGLAVILDHVRCMDKGDLHPVDKNFVARRLSLFARRDLYGEPNLTTDGPVFSRAVREADGAVRISFKPGTAKGLTSGRLKMANDLTLSRFIKMDDPVKGFAICGSDGVWKEAEATIEGETVVLRAQGLAAPTRFHYGFWSITRSDNFEFGQRLSLYNGEGLPLSPLAPMDVEVASTSAKTADPVFLPGSGLFNPTTNVTLSCATAGATIRYTTNGSEPTASSPAYTAPIAVSANTTLKARAFVSGKEASDVMVATYTLGTPAAPTADPMWSVSPYDASAWTPLANNILAGKTGTTSGGLAWGNISKDAANLTDGTVPVTPDGSKLVGFCDNSSITYTFTAPQTITELRLSTRIDGSTGDLATKLKYAGLHLEDVYVKKSGSSDWVALGRPVYQHTSLEQTGAMMFALSDDGIGHLAENVVELKIVFLKGEVVWSQVAEIEASGYATDFEPVTPAAGSLVVDTTVSDHCVLQRGVANKVKGTATAGATVTVTFGGVTASAVANANGEYVVSFNPGAANATGRNLVVSDSVNTVTIADVLVGDVFYLSGQSNVRFEVESYNKSEALADCDYPNFRMMVMPSANSGLIAATDKDLPCSWIASSSTTCTAMSSFGFFLGRELIKSKNVPIGIVSAAVKGTDIASWLPNGGCDKYMASRCDHLAVKGAIWYQGESDALNYSDRAYPQKLKNLIQYWRTNRGNSNLPVVVVQLPRYRDTYRNCGDTEKINCWGLFRVDQDLAIAEVDNAVCVPTIDYGAEYNIHPSDKHLMGARIALAVRNLMYGDAVSYRCPYPTSAVKSADGSSVTVSFPSSTVLSFATDNASMSFGAEEDMFSVGGVHVKPTISADGHSLVFSGSFADATSVDYALCGFPQILVRDANGFPMPPFSLALSSGGEDPVDPTDEPTQMFYIGETGYDSWSDAYKAAKNGDTIKVGKDAQFAVSGGTAITIDLCGRSVTWNSGGYAYTGAITLVDSGTPSGSGSLVLANGNQNTKTTVDLSALAASQISGTGRFYFGPATKVIFPSDMSYEACMSRINFQDQTAGSKIVVQGVNYEWNGSAWISDSPAATYSITVTQLQNGTLTASATSGIEAGTTITVTATPAEGYAIVSVTVNGVAITGNTFVMPAADVTLSATFEKQSTPPVDPPEEPAGESDRQWTAEDYDPAAWTPLANNILAGLTATAGGTGNLAYDAKDVTKLTDGKVSATADKSEVAGLCPGAELVWTFAEPQTLEKIRVSSLRNPEGNGKLFAGISVADILVQRSGSSDWVSLGVSFSRSGSSTAGGAQYATLSDPGLGYLAVDVTAIKFVQGKVEAFGNYYSEMEAVGRKSSESPAYPPAMSGFKVRPWGESVEFSGMIVSLGSGATSCDVYLACGADADHLGAPVKIYTGNAGAFHYELEGLSQSTGYAYSLAVSNNAATVASCAVSGGFTTTAEVHPDWSAYKWAVIGDSLTDPTLNPYAGSFYYNFVARDTGIQLVYTNGVGSTGYKNRQNENRCFYQRLLTDPLPSDVDVVTIFGSVNDWGQVRNAADAGSPSDRIEDGKTTLAAYMNKAIDVVQAQAPGAKLILAGSLYYYNVVGEAHARANETLRAVAEARGIPFYDWLTEDPNDPLDFHQIANDPTAEGSFAKRYARDCPSTIIPGETSFGHPSAEYHEAWLSPHFRGILTTAIASVKPVTLGEPVARPLTDYNGNTVSIAFTGDLPDGTEVLAKVTIGGVDYAGEVGDGVVTFEVPSDAVTSGNVYAGKITVTVGGVDYTKDVTLEQGTFKVDEDAEWIAESAASFGMTGAWSGDKAEVSGGVIAVSNALFTAAKAEPESAVVTFASTFSFRGPSDEEFGANAQAGVKVVEVGGVNRYAFFTGDGVVTNFTVAADVSHAVSMTATVDKVANTIVYAIGGNRFGPFAGDSGKGALSKVRYIGATDVMSLDGSYRDEFLDTNLASVGGEEYATVADALAAGGADVVWLLWDASWRPAAAGDYNIATNGHLLVIGGELAYQVKDNGDGTVTVTVTGGETPDTPVAGSITLSGSEVKVAVANAQSGFWYTLAKTTDLKDPFIVADDAQWVSGAELLTGTGELTIALGDGETAAFYRVVVSETAPVQK